MSQYISAQNVQNRTFIGAITAAIKAVCILLIRGVDVANTAVSMGAEAVKRAQKKSLIDGTIESMDYEESALLRAAVERQKVREAVDQYLGADGTGERRKNIENEIQSLRRAIASERARIEAEQE